MPKEQPLREKDEECFSGVGGQEKALQLRALQKMKSKCGSDGPVNISRFSARSTTRHTVVPSPARSYFLVGCWCTG